MKDLTLYEIEVTLKGAKEKSYIRVEARNRLDAMNWFIESGRRGKIHSISIPNINLIRNK